MTSLSNMIQAFHKEEEGATATEYVIMVVLIACFLIAIIGSFGKKIKEKFQESITDVGKVKSGAN